MNREMFPVRRKTSNGSKVCAYANCRSNGRNLPKDTDITFIPFAKPCTLFRDEEIDFLLNKKTGEREHIISQCNQCTKALLWIKCCRRKDNRLAKLTDITRSMYVCSKHFVNLPTEDGNEDPLPATVSPEEVLKKRRSSPMERKPVVPVKLAKKLPEQRIATAPIDEFIPSEPITKDLIVVNLKSSPAGNCRRKSFEERRGAVRDFAEKTTQTFLMDVTRQLPPEMNITTFAHKQMLAGWACMVQVNDASFVRYASNTHSCLLEVRVFHTGSDLSCETFVLGQSLPQDSNLLAEQRKIKTYDNLQDFMWLLEKMTTCEGVFDKDLVEGFLKTNNSTSGKFCYRTNTVRSAKCKLFSRGSTCSECMKYENKLKRHSRKSTVEVDKELNHHVNNRYLTREQLVAKLKEVENNNRALGAKARRWQLKVEKMDTEENREMLRLFANAKDEMGTGSPFGIFLEEQLKVTGRKSCLGFKWSTDILKWCLSIFNKSTVAYKTLRAGGFITLPSARTIKNFKSSFKETPEFFDRSLECDEESVKLGDPEKHLHIQSYIIPNNCIQPNDHIEEYILPHEHIKQPELLSNEQIPSRISNECHNIGEG